MKIHNGLKLSGLCALFGLMAAAAFAEGWESYVPYGDVGGMGAVNCPVENDAVCLSLSCTDTQPLQFVLVITQDIGESRVTASIIVDDTLAGAVELAGGYSDGLSEFSTEFDPGRHMKLMETLQLNRQGGGQAVLALKGEKGQLDLPFSLAGGRDALAKVREACLM